MNANQLRDIVAKYYTKQNYAIFYELGLNEGGQFRADVLALNFGCQIVIIEVKSSVADFTSDTKYHNYAKFSDKFLFCFHVDVYDKLKLLGKLPIGCGILVVNNLGKIKSVQNAKYQMIADDDVRFNLILRCAFRSADRNRYKIKSKFTQ